MADRAGWRSYAALCAVTIAAYANSFSLGLPLDAQRLVVEDNRVHAARPANWSLILQTPYWFPHMQDRLYRPVTTASLLVNFVLLGNGANPVGYHVTNVLLHAMNVLLLFALARRLLRDPAAAWCAAALWAVHPVTTESVANVAGRADLLAAACVLGALVLYACRREHPAIGVLCLAGCLSKESAAVLPGLMLLWDWTTAKRPRVRDYAPVLVALAVVFAIREAMFARGPWPEMPFLDNPLLGMGFWTARLTAVKVIGVELALLVWPANLAFDHSYNQVAAATWRDPWLWVTVAVIAELLLIAVARRRRDPLLFFAAGFCGLTLLPSSNLLVLIASTMAVRFLYLPAAAFALLSAGLIFRLRNRRAAYAAAAGALLLLGARTVARNPVWESDLTLASADVARAPRSFRVHAILSGSLMLQDRTANLDRALEEAEAGWSILQDLPPEKNSDHLADELSLLCRAKGDTLGGVDTAAGRAWYERALQYARRAEEIADSRLQAFDDLQLRHGRALPVRSGYEDVYANLGLLYLSFGQPPAALDSFRKAREQAPLRRELHDDSVLAALRAQDLEAAARLALEEVLVFGVTPETAAVVAGAFARLPDGGCAIQGLQVNYGCSAVKRNLCAAAAEAAAVYRAGRRSSQARTVEDAAAAQGCPRESQ